MAPTNAPPPAPPASGPPHDLDQAIVSFLARLPLFAEVAPAEAMDVIRLLRPVPLKPGEQLFACGDPPGAMWVLGEGCKVEISLPPQGGAAPVVLSTLGTGDTVGEMALIDQSPRCATARVVAGGQAQRIEATDFETLRKHFHPAAFKMMRRLAGEVARRLRTISARLAPASAEARAPSERPALPAGARVTSEALAQIPPFTGLPASVRLALSQKLREHAFPAGAAVFRQGEPGDSLLVVVEGELALRRQERALAKLGPGGLCGLISAVDGGPREVDCLAVSASRVLRLSREDLDWLFRSGNRFAYQIVNEVTRQLVSLLRELNASLLVQCDSLPEAARAESDADKAHGALAQAELDMDVELMLDEVLGGG